MYKIKSDKQFKDNLSKFIELCNKWLNIFVIGKEGFITNERLIRGYVTEGILPKPERIGREAIYNYKHLIYFLACRDLLSENWPLSKIKEILTNLEFEELEINLLKKYNQEIENDSLEVIKELKKGTDNKTNRVKVNLKQNLDHSSSMISKSYQNSNQTIKEFESDLPYVLKDEFTTFTLASWLSLAIKSNKMLNMTSDLAFRISNAVKSALLDSKLKERDHIFENINQLNDLDFKNQQLERQIITLENKFKSLEHSFDLKELELSKYRNFIEQTAKDRDLERKENDASHQAEIESFNNVIQNISHQAEQEIENLNNKFSSTIEDMEHQKREEIKNLNKNFLSEMENKINILNEQNKIEKNKYKKKILELEKLLKNKK